MLRTIFVLAGICYMVTGFCQNQASVTIDADKPGARVSPTLHGIFFEEISHAGEGGLYAELIQNRGFEECRLPQGTHLQDGYIVPLRTPHFSMPDKGVSDWKMEWPLKSEWPAWSMDTSGGSEMKVSLTEMDPLNKATPHSMQLSILKNRGRADLVNEGFWGIGVREGENYLCSFYIHTNEKYKGSVKASLQSADGTVLTSFIFNSVHNRTWKKYSCVLKATKTDPAAKFVLSFGSTGTVWVDFVSLFPERTFRNRPNGLRLDLAQSIADLKPAFIRWPGGCFVEGINIQSAPDWRRTIGPVEDRPGTYSPWGYWTSDGFGYHEYLQFCEDIGAAALYVFNVGVSCDYRSGTFVPEDSLGSYIQNALDAIEYAIGPVDSKWGRKRAAGGHPSPFPLKYVEVGNEQHGPLYAKRYNLFYEAIKTKYPDIKVIASMGIGDVNKNTLDSMKQVEMVDEHAYKSAWWSMSHYDHFDGYRRGKWDMYVGEYATNNGVGKGNMEAALSDAVYVLAMERNGDLVKMSSYAPLLVNVNDEDWPVNLINFNASQSFGRISYYALGMLAAARADINLSTAVKIHRTAEKKPLFKGTIGLATWDTQTEYKDIEIIQNGQAVYKSDFISGTGQWTPVRGEWKIQDSGLAQTAEGPQLFAMLKDRSFDTYTLTLKAKKLSGLNAFIIPFAIKDTNTFLRAHIGSWLNSHGVIEKVTNGFDVTDLSEQKRLPKPIEQGRWYAIRLEVGMDTVRCWLDDELIMTYTEPEKLFALAGKNEKTGDLILKVVNAGDAPCLVNWQLNGIGDLYAEGDLTSLKSETADAENSFQDPKKYIPEKRKVTGISPNFEMEFPPYSISVLRLKEKKGANTLFAQQAVSTSYRPTRSEMLERYRKAHLLDSLALRTLFKTNVQAYWQEGGQAFWYRNILKDSVREYWYVDAVKGNRRKAFDEEKLAASLQAVSGKQLLAAHLKIDSLVFSKDARVISLKLDSNYWKCDLVNYTTEKIAALPVDSTRNPGYTREWERWNSFSTDSLSPDKQWIAYVKDGNVFARPNRSSGTDRLIQFTRDADTINPYGSLAWSPDSKYIVGYRIHPVEDSSVYFVLSSVKGMTRGQLKKHPYKQPGDPFTSFEMMVFTVEGGKTIKVNTPVFDFFEAPELHWREKDSRYFLYEKVDRGHQRFRIFEGDAQTGQTRTIVDEQTKTFIYESRLFTHYLPATGEILITSEKDGWRHIYRIDSRTGAETQVTKGEWIVRDIDSVDNKRREIWFTASGRNSGEDPYNAHYYRIGFDGSHLLEMTKATGHHTVVFSPDKRYYTDTWSEVNKAPVSELHKTADAAIIMELERADISGYLAAGFRLPEPFHAKGRDGITDIWGVVCRPADFDSTKRYPVIENIYAGPQDAFVPKIFGNRSFEMQSMAQLGFIVVQIDGMGTANRSKAFHDVCWKNLADAGFPDRILWIKALASRYPYVDTSRVGLFGTSAGGQNALGGLLFHGDFYKAAVSSCGCHDNRVDKQWWNEQWMGFPVGKHYEEQSNVTNAAKLTGDLLLIVGEADTNVPPESTYRVADALIKAGKIFDFLPLPGMDHTDGGPYGRIKKRDFFVKHLLDVDPPLRNSKDL